MNDIVTGWCNVQLVQLLVDDITGDISDWLVAEDDDTNISDKFLYINDAIVVLMLGGNVPAGINNVFP